MRESNSFAAKSPHNIKQHAQRLSKGHILQWIASILPQNDKCPTIQSLSTGEVYCKIMNHYFPSLVSSNRIISSPFNEYQYSINLRLFQRSLTQAKIIIPFDIQKINKFKFSQNWSLITSLHKTLDGNEVIKDACDMKTPKRSLPDQSQVLERKKALQQNKTVLNQESTKTDIVGLGSVMSQIERVKQILISSYNDTYKVMIIKKLFGIVEVKLEEDQIILVKETNICDKAKKK